MKNRKIRRDEGYVLVGVIVLVALSLLITASMLDSSSTNAKTRALVTTQADKYYEVEETVNRVVGWLQMNSKNLAGLFRTADFNAAFTIGAPSVGSNEGEQFAVPTMVKLTGTNQSAILSKNSWFGTSAFPNAHNIDTGATFDPVASFQNTDFGAANARIVMVWARGTNGAFEPVFRVDVITGNHPDRGVHSYSHIYSKVVPGAWSQAGFYGKTGLRMGNSVSTTCSSLRFTHNGTNWVQGGGAAGCFLASDLTVLIDGTVSGRAGSLSQNGVVVDKGTLQPGPECEGAGCHNLTLENPGHWAAACPASAGVNVTASALGGAPLAGGCYDTITVDANMQMTDTTTAYHVNKINFVGNNKKLTFGAIPVGQKVKLYVEELDPNNNRSKFEGNRVMNTNSAGLFNAPHQLELHYTGTLPLDVGGNTNIYAHLFAPYAAVASTGNSDYYGGIEALHLTVTGNTDYFYDESIGTQQPVGDLAYDLRKTSQRYR